MRSGTARLRRSAAGGRHAAWLSDIKLDRTGQICNEPPVASALELEHIRLRDAEPGGDGANHSNRGHDRHGDQGKRAGLAGTTPRARPGPP